MPQSRRYATTLLCGAMLVLPSAERSDPQALAQLLHEQGVTQLTFPPALLAERSPDVPLKTVVVAGEVFSADMVARWSKRPAHDQMRTGRPRRRSASA